MKLSSFKSYFLDLVFPVFCVGCKKEGSVLCDACAGRIVIKRVPVPRRPPSVSLALAACEYRDPIVAELVKRLKYDGLTDIAKKCAALIQAHLSLTGFVPDAHTVVTAVPLSRVRLKERGFNQAELIARNVADTLSLKYQGDLLARVRHTQPQTSTMKRSERMQNVKDAFACYTSKAVEGKEIILVDDVMTAGATLSECAKALKKAGAKKVITLVVAA